MSAAEPAPFVCPSCGSIRLFRDGTRQAGGQTVQRYLCRSCATRFSPSTAKPKKLIISKSEARIGRRALPRQREISNRLIAMLNELPKDSERIFPTTYRNMFGCYDRVRRRAAAVQKNPRLLSIELRTFRHWCGSMLAYYLNGNVIKVQRLLGHKRIENTMKYIGMVNIKDYEFEVATATTDEEIRQLGIAGFQKYDERKIGEMCISYYRRPKNFDGYGS